MSRSFSPPWRQPHARSSCTAQSADLSRKSIRFIMPYPPGGSSDILARPIANEMTKSLGQFLAGV